MVEERWERGNNIFDGTDIPINTSQHHSHSEQEKTSLTPIIPDFQVNQNAGPNGARQISPAIGRDGSGNFVITWGDERSIDSDIYAQRYNSNGDVMGSNFKVNDDVGSIHQKYPAIAVDVNGNFVITWQDERNGITDIYAQRYNSNGSALGSNFKVNDDSELGTQSPPAIAVDSSHCRGRRWQFCNCLGR
jgi:hypothetical protein